MTAFGMVAVWVLPVSDRCRAEVSQYTKMLMSSKRKISLSLPSPLWR